MNEKKRITIGVTILVGLSLSLTSLLGMTIGAQAGSPSERPDRIALRPQAEGAWSTEGWVPIGPGQTLTFTHSVGGDPALYAVDLWFLDTGPVNYGINQIAYGGVEDNGVHYGAYWWGLTDTQINVTRETGDLFVDQVFLRIREPDPPDWDSGWLDIDPGVANILTLNHNLGGNEEDYRVGIKFRDSDADGLGIHQYNIGGNEDSNRFYGAAWLNLTNSSLHVLRFGNDIYADQVRVFINLPDSPPAFDSGWSDFALGQTQVISHNLDINPFAYVISTSQRSPQHGINIMGVGGIELHGQYRGSDWESMTGQTISLSRMAQDIYAPEMRVRIWTPNYIFLPSVTGDYSPPD